MENLALDYLLQNYPDAYVYLSKVHRNLIPNLVGQEVIIGLYAEKAEPYLPHDCEWRNGTSGTRYVPVKVIGHNIAMDQILLESGDRKAFSEVNQNPVSYKKILAKPL